MWVKKQQLEPYMEQVTGSKLRKEYYKAVHCHPTYLTCAEYKNVKYQDRIKSAGRNINKLRYADDITLTAESEEEQKNLLMKVKRRVKKLA